MGTQEEIAFAHTLSPTGEINDPSWMAMDWTEAKRLEFQDQNALRRIDRCTQAIASINLVLRADALARYKAECHAGVRDELAKEGVAIAAEHYEQMSFDVRDGLYNALDLLARDMANGLADLQERFAKD